MLIWENSDLFCDVWWWWGVGLITPHTRQRDTVTVAESDNPSQNGINFDHWSLNNCPLSQKTSSQALVPSIICNCSDCHSEWQDLCPLARRTLALCLCYYSQCKSVRLSPPSPDKPFCIRIRDAGLWFPGTTPALRLWEPHPITCVPTSSASVTLFVTQGPPHHMLTLAVNKATQCQGLGPR